MYSVNSALYRREGGSDAACLTAFEWSVLVSLYPVMQSCAGSHLSYVHVAIRAYLYPKVHQCTGACTVLLSLLGFCTHIAPVYYQLYKHSSGGMQAMPGVVMQQAELIQVADLPHTQGLWIIYVGRSGAQRDIRSRQI